MNFERPETKEVDILVIGAGIAGLEAAYAACRFGLTVAVLSKGASASPGVLGFNAVVAEADSAARFYDDTRRGGWEINDSELVRVLTVGSGQAVRRLEALGVNFDKKPDQTGAYHLLQPLGCSVARLVHSGNHTGRRAMEVLTAALAERGVAIWKRHMALSLLTEDGRVVGAIVLDTATGVILIVAAKAVVLATGGGHLAQGSTYPDCLTGDGYALAYQAGAELIDLEFIQHEPCHGIYPRPLGISTTLLAGGGVLRNAQGRRFVLDAYPTESAAPKDMLARLITMEIQAGRGSEHGGVYLDLTGLPEAKIKIDHVMYYQRFRDAGLDLTKDVVEVAPAAHSIMGGVRIDSHCRTGVPGLFAAGEVTGGVHGANRLGGNAGTEVHVFGALAGENAARYAGEVSGPGQVEKTAAAAGAVLTSWQGNSLSEIGNGLPELKEKIRRLMTASMGPVRKKQTLSAALAQLDSLSEVVAAIKSIPPPELVDWLEVRNLLLISRLACRAALLREESRGVHYRADFPRLDDAAWKKQIGFTKANGVTFHCL